ncbi:MAG: 5'-3'-deoxyribonucleotidase [bacterium]|nr:5'-3'-deoxyribonucleotidase [bacterium]
MKIVLIDMDGPLADFEGRFLEIWKEKYPDSHFISFEDRKSLHLISDYPPEYKEKIELIMQEEGFFSSLSPNLAAINAINEMVSIGYNVFICTAGIYSNKNCLTEKKLWIEKYFGEKLARTTIFTKDKTLIRGNYLIDDNPNMGNGIVTPEWEHIIYDQPFNKNSIDKRRIKSDWSDWKDVIVP